MPKGNNSGFIHFIPLLLLAAAVLVISFADYKSMFKNNNLNQSVLSESSENNNQDENKDEAKQNEVEDAEDKKVEDAKDDSVQQNSPVQKPTEIKSDDSEGDEDRPDEELDDSSDGDDDSQLEDDTEDEVEIESEDNSKLKIKIKSNGNEFEFESEGENINIQSDFPLSVDPETNELTVTTPDGEKVVAILPDQAINNMFNNEKLTVVTSTTISEDENGELEYQIEGQDDEKLFGVINIKIHKIFTVSAQTGQETSVQVDLLNKILDLLSV